MKKIVSLIFAAFAILWHSCASEDGLAPPPSDMSESQTMSTDDVMGLYDDYSSAFRAGSRSAEIMTPAEIGASVAGLSISELESYRENLIAKYPDCRKNIDPSYYINKLLKYYTATQVAQYVTFIMEYPFVTNPKEYLIEAVNKMSDPSLQRRTVAAGAAIDNVVAPMIEPILMDTPMVVVSLHHYFAECEHRLIEELAEMVCGDILVDLLRGGPGDATVDVYLTEADIPAVIEAVTHYVECKHNGHI